jgi:hypothetical protein
MRTAVPTEKENKEVWISSPLPFFTLTLYALNPYIMVACYLPVHTHSAQNEESGE